MQCHPAVQSWLRLHPGSPEPRRVMLLKETPKSFVCRLDGVGPGGVAVIAKRCPRKDGEFDSFVYNEVLRQLPIESLRCYGFFIENNDEYGWLFLEDGGTKTVRDLTESIPTLVAHTLGLLHSLASSLESCAPLLPDRGPAHYLSTLRTARERIQDGLSQACSNGPDRPSLESLVSYLEIVEDNWEQVRQICGTFPQTLVHADFQMKNVMVRESPSGLTLLPIDWGDAGWGPPAVDLAGIDCTSYWFAVRDRWPGIELRDVDEQARCGAMLRALSAVSWEAERLLWGATEKAVRRLRMYVPWVSASAQALGLKA